MEKLKRYYNQNREKIWGTIIIIAFVFALLQLANAIAKNNNDKKIEQAKLQIENRTNTQESTTQDETNSSQTDTQTTNTKKSTIEEFVSYCNKKDLESAYNMITEECKNEMFSDLETFERIYYNSTFENNSKDVSIEKWVNNTYMVKFTENALATGKIVKTKEDQKIDYITVVENENDDYRLNINSYIGYKEIGKTKEKENITMEVLGKHTYMDYEIYTIKATNNTIGDIVLDTLDNAESIYIKDSKGLNYPAYTNELAESMLTISSGHTKQLDIKFYSSYVSTKKIQQLVFSDLWKSRKQIEFKIDL